MHDVQLKNIHAKLVGDGKRACLVGCRQKDREFPAAVPRKKIVRAL